MLGGLSPATFMRRHWQKKPLLVRQALPGVQPPLSRKALFDLAADDGVESRLVQRRGGKWSMRGGPLARAQLPPFKQPGWTLLVQSLNLRVSAAHALLSAFRFIPDARLDDLMMSYATDGGGVGPHVDSYDVFLLQVQGRRRWRIGRLTDPALVPGLPLKILQHFKPEEEWLLEPGDMLYLPPGWAHDGLADGECMTCSIGFRAASRSEFAHEVLQRTLDAPEDDDDPGPLYRDPKQPATDQPALIPEAMQRFATDAVAHLLRKPDDLACSLGEWLSEPQPQVWFPAGSELPAAGGLRLADGTRMLYDARRIYVNGESFAASGRDATLMRRLADRRGLTAAEAGRLSAGARELLDDWAGAGWLQPLGDG